MKEAKKYLVQIFSHEDEETNSVLMTGDKIIQRIDMKDCYKENLVIYDISEFDKVERLEIHGPWHKSNDPLYIKCTNSKGEIVISGYGTDH